MPNFVSFVASTAELAHVENRVLNHSSSLFDVLGIKALALWNKFILTYLLTKEALDIFGTQLQLDDSTVQVGTDVCENE